MTTFVTGTLYFVDNVRPRAVRKLRIPTFEYPFVRFNFLGPSLVTFTTMDTTGISMANGTICSLEEYNTSLSDPFVHCLTRGDSIGLTLTAQAGLLSLVTVLYVFFVIVRNAVYRFRSASTRTWYIIQKPMDILMLSLFFADLLQAIGAVMDLKWIHNGHLEAGEFCSAQGVIKQLGEVGVALSTLTIALYTFIGVWMGRAIESNKITVAVIGVVWFVIALLTLLGNVLNLGIAKGFERPVSYWCWINPENYLLWCLFGEYLWIFITIFFSSIIYIPLCFWSRGNITLGDGAWWKFTIHRAEPSEDLKGIRRRSLIMLLYPMVYCFITLPLGIVRWITFMQVQHGRSSSVSPALTFAVITIFGLSGVFNAILLLKTRPESGLFSRLNCDDIGFAPSSSQLHPAESLASGSNLDVKEEHDVGRLPSF